MTPTLQLLGLLLTGALPQTTPSLAWSDVDGDGLQDAVVLEATGELRLLLNEGAHGFRDATPGARLPLDLAARGIAFGDLEQDGRDELLVVTRAGSVELLRHGGDARFEWLRDFLPVPSGPVLDAAWIDLDGDGWSDLALELADRRRLFLRNEGGTRFQPMLWANASTPGPGLSWQPVERTRESSPLAEPEQPVHPEGLAQRRLLLPPAASDPDAPLASGPVPGSCADSVADQAGGACLQASSVPTLGALYPLGRSFYVDAGGDVGVGTQSPLAKLDVDGDDLRVAEGSLELYDGARRAIALDPSAVSLTNASGVQTVHLDGATSGVELALSNDTGAETVRIESEPNTGAVSLRNSGGAERLRATGGVGSGASISLRNSVGAETVDLDGDFHDGGLLFLRNASGSTRATAGTSSTDGGGFANLYNGSGVNTISLDAQYTQGEGALILRNSAGTGTLLLDADSNGGAYISVRNDVVGLDNEIQLQARNQAGVAQIGLLAPSGQGTVELININSGAGSLYVNETDGSAAFRMRGSWLTLHNASGSTTQTYSRITGSKSAVVDAGDEGRRLMYAIESPELWFQDSGRARLEGGQKRIDLDPVFLETVTIDGRHPMRVCVTLTGEGRGVWVEKGRDHFVVHESAGGAGNAGFDWRVTAKRRGTEALRLQVCKPVALEAVEAEPVSVPASEQP